MRSAGAGCLLVFEVETVVGVRRSHHTSLKDTWNSGKMQCGWDDRGSSPERGNALFKGVCKTLCASTRVCIASSEPFAVHLQGYG